jgi:hypothetical protein
MIGNVGGAERDLADLFRCVRNLSLSLSLSLFALLLQVQTY